MTDAEYLHEFYKWVDSCKFAAAYFLERLDKRDMDVKTIFTRYHDVTDSIFTGDIPNLMILSFRDKYPTEYDLWLRTNITRAAVLERIYAALS